MNYQGKKAAFCTLGCKLNFSETSAIAHKLENLGFQKVGFDEEADLYVINTCSVTHEGDKSSRNMIRRAIRRNPSAKIVVTGCYAQLKSGEIGKIPGVDLVLGNREKFHLADWLGDLTKNTGTDIHTSDLTRYHLFDHSISAGDRTRCFLKIQDGCDYFCTFCVVPFARGRNRNDTIENTVKEAEKAVGEGFREIVLTGVNIGEFGKSTGETFTALLAALEKVKGLQRLRMGSVEPNLLTDEIISMAAASPVIMPHFHIPLQSGSDDMLALMKRKYSAGLFASRIAEIRKQLPSAFIGVDVVAGMNGETEQMFLESYDFLSSHEISQLHAFPYSERSGTRATEIPLKVPEQERKRRTHRYINLSERKLRLFYEKNLGTTRTVLFETAPEEMKMEGFTDNYIRVETPFIPETVSEIRPVRLLSVQPNGNVSGEIEYS